MMIAWWVLVIAEFSMVQWEPSTTAPAITNGPVLIHSDNILDKITFQEVEIFLVNPLKVIKSMNVRQKAAAAFGAT